MSETFRDVPEIFEREIEQCINARNELLATFKDLGPPDLVHIVKSMPAAKQQIKEVGSYHFAIGVDTSSSASIAAYVNSLTYSMEQPVGWFSSRTPWKLSRSIYCCYNAFSCVDVRVEARIPGGVKAYTVDANGQMRPTTAEIWQETYVSAMLRAIHRFDSPEGCMLGVRRLDPFPTSEHEQRFLEAATKLFWNGWQLGAEDCPQLASPANNYLSRGVAKYFSITRKSHVAIPFFKQFQAKDTDIAALVATCQLEADDEVAAVRTLHAALSKSMNAAALLIAQVQFLTGKGKYDMAIDVAKLAIKSSPMEYSTWSRLVDLYILIEDYDSALVALNSCPMVAFPDIDYLRMQPAAKVSVPRRDSALVDTVSYGPIPLDSSSTSLSTASSSSNGINNVSRTSIPVPNTSPSMIDTVISSNAVGMSNANASAASLAGASGSANVDSALERLRAPLLRGTFRLAYRNLVRICAAIGWDAFLRCRGNVFVMEDEYRQQRLSPNRQSSISDNFSQAESEDAEKEGNGEEAAAAAAAAAAKDPTKVHDSDEHDHASGRKEEGGNEEEEEDALPDSTAESCAVPATSTNLKMKRPERASAISSPTRNLLMTTKKRLCERWLDNLILILFEDMRVYTIFKSELQHHHSMNIPYHRSAREWLILGDLCRRLLKLEDAKEAYQRCLDKSFSTAAWLALLQIYTDEGKLSHALNAASKLVKYADNCFDNIMHPTATSAAILQLIQEHGLHRVKATAATLNLSEMTSSQLGRFFEYSQRQATKGHDY